MVKIHTHMHRHTYTHTHTHTHTHTQGQRVKDVMSVPGIREGGWNLSQLAPVSQREMEREKAALHLFVGNILREVCVCVCVHVCVCVCVFVLVHMFIY